MTSDKAPGSDRRRALRHVACFPSIIEHGGSEKMTTMIADLGDGGALLFARNPDVRVGDEVSLELHVALDGGAARLATGRVVRVAALPDERVSLWTHQVGVEFHELFALSDAEVAALDERQLPFGKRA
jgi:hypothetical protein